MLSLLTEDKKTSACKNANVGHGTPSFDANCNQRKVCAEDYNKTSDTIRAECSKKQNKFKITEIKQEIPTTKLERNALVAACMPLDAQLQSISPSNSNKCHNASSGGCRKECAAYKDFNERVNSRAHKRRTDAFAALPDAHMEYLLEMERIKQAAMQETMSTFCGNCMEIAKESITSRVDA